MKIRTDFVTNSSDSSFVLTICFNLKNGSRVRFEGNSWTSECGTVDYFEGYIWAHLNPRELAAAKSVEEMIAILTAGVQDGSRNVFEHPYTTYSSKEFHKKGCDDDEEERDYDEGNDIELEPDSYDAYDFIKRIRRKIHSMDEIEMIEVSGVESYGNDLDDYVQHYYYDMETGHGYGKVSGYKPADLGGASTGFLDAGYCDDYDMEYENTGDDKEDDEYNDEDW